MTTMKPLSPLDVPSTVHVVNTYFVPLAPSTSVGTEATDAEVPLAYQPEAVTSVTLAGSVLTSK